MSFNITVEGGSSVRLPTAGKYCDRDIVITAEGGTEDLNAVLTEQEGLIATLQNTLKNKAAVGIKAVDCGSFILDADLADDYYVPHNLGQIPSFVFAFVEGVESSANWKNYIMNITHVHDAHLNAGATRVAVYYRLYGKADGSTFTANAVYINSGSACTATDFCLMADSTKMLKAGVEYKWVCGVIEGLG